MSYQQLKDQKVLVTGAAGFIGSNLVRRLLSLNAEVVGVDDFSTGKRSNIEDIEDEFRFIESDLSVISNPLPSFEDTDYIIHLAAIPSVPKSLSSPALVHRANVTGTLRVLEFAREIKPENMVLISSSAIYGNAGDKPLEEDRSPAPQSLYGATKVAAEEYARSYVESHDVPVVMIRFFNVYGPYQNPDSQYASVICSFIEKLLNHSSPEIHGDGEQTRDFVYVNDALEGILSAVDRPDLAGNAYNISAGNKTSINKLARILIDISGRNLDPIHTDPREGDIRHSYASLEKAQNDLEYDPSIQLEEGLKRTYDWYKNHA